VADHCLAASPSPAPRFPPLRRSPVQIGRACKERSLSQRLVPRGVSTGWRGQVPCLLTSPWLELHYVSTLYSFVHCLVLWNPAATVTVDKFLLPIFLVRAVTPRDALLGPSCGESSTNFPDTHPDPPSPSLLSFFPAPSYIYSISQSEYCVIEKDTLPISASHLCAPVVSRTPLLGLPSQYATQSARLRAVGFKHDMTFGSRVLIPRC